MPGLILFKRRWSLASDDIFMPATLLVVVHFFGYFICSQFHDPSNQWNKVGLDHKDFCDHGTTFFLTKIT